MKVEWILSLVFATLAGYAWWEYRKTLAQRVTNAQELHQLGVQLGKLVIQRQPEMPVAEMLIGALSAAMVVGSGGNVKAVAEFLESCSKGMLRDQQKIQGLMQQRRPKELNWRGR